jgi:hypothetical protein
VRLVAIPIFVAALANTQYREIGFLAGGGVPTSVSMQGAAAGVSAGFGPGASAGILIGHDL